MKLFQLGGKKTFFDKKNHRFDGVRGPSVGRHRERPRERDRETVEKEKMDWKCVTLRSPSWNLGEEGGIDEFSRVGGYNGTEIRLSKV